MSECKISNCAFYTCCYGKKKKRLLGLDNEGKWAIPDFLILYIYPCLFSGNNK